MVQRTSASSEQDLPRRTVFRPASPRRAQASQLLSARIGSTPALCSSFARSMHPWRLTPTSSTPGLSAGQAGRAPGDDLVKPSSHHRDEHRRRRALLSAREVELAVSAPPESSSRGSQTGWRPPLPRFPRGAISQTTGLMRFKRRHRSRSRRKRPRDQQHDRKEGERVRQVRRRPG